MCCLRGQLWVKVSQAEKYLQQSCGIKDEGWLISTCVVTFFLSVILSGKIALRYAYIRNDPLMKDKLC